jgi:hypothetical protein
LSKSSGIRTKAAAVHEELAKRNFARDLEFMTPLFLRSRNWTLTEAQFPILDVTFDSSAPLRLRLTCDNWDELPPAEQVFFPGLDLWNGRPTNSIFHTAGHSGHGGPFICMRGFRGYHTHGSHVNDRWANYRGRDGNNLAGLLDQLSQAWRAMVGR